MKYKLFFDNGRIIIVEAVNKKGAIKKFLETKLHEETEMYPYKVEKVIKSDSGLSWGLP